MKIMTFFELKKIFVKSSSKIALFILVGVIIVLSFLTIGSIEYVDSSGNHHTGITAYNKLADAKEAWKGNVTESVLEKVIEENSQINTSEEYLSKDVNENNIAFSKKQGFADIKEMINMSFSDFQEYDYYKADSVSTAELKDFYSNRVESLKKWLYSDSISDTFSETEKAYLISKYEQIETPFYYEYAGSWVAMLDYLPSFIMLISLIGAFLVAGIFSDEFRQKADSIFFSTKHGRQKAIKSKINAGFICITTIYWIPLAIYSMIVFICLGTDGANCLIQTGLGNWKSFYNITFLQEYILTIIGGYIGVLFMLTLSMLISAKTRSSVVAVTTPFILLLIPSFLSNFPVLSKILGILPDQLLQISSAVNNFNLYQIGEKVIGAIPILFIVYLIFYFLLVPFLYRTYKKAEIK